LRTTREIIAADRRFGFDTETLVFERGGTKLVGNRDVVTAKPLSPSVKLLEKPALLVTVPVAPA